MLRKEKEVPENELFRMSLEQFIDHKNPIVLLSAKINWCIFEKEFAKYYNPDYGRPCKPIRLMVSLLLLKQIYNESDETVVQKWCENPYWQYFSGNQYFQWSIPCVATELTKFRNRIGKSGVEKIFQESILVHGQSAMEKEVIPDTTVQEKNITFPTDTKLHLKIIDKCMKIGEEYGIKWRQSYKRTLKKLRFATRYINVASRAKDARKAMHKIKTIAGRLHRELNRKLRQDGHDQYSELLNIMKRILTQTKNSKNKVYSVHEPAVSCIAKGKSDKKYEFGSKVSVLITKTSGLIVGAVNFEGNPYDGNTLQSTLEQSERLRGVKSEKAIVDEGYRGRAKIDETEILRVHQQPKKGYNKRKWKNWFKRRSSVEAVISHLKNDFGLVRNYLKGVVGDEINLLLSVAAFNFKKLMRKLAFYFHFLKLDFCIVFLCIVFLIF